MCYQEILFLTLVQGHRFDNNTPIEETVWIISQPSYGLNTIFSNRCKRFMMLSKLDTCVT